MKYCVDYTSDSCIFDIVDEINVPFSMDTILNLVEFLDEYSNDKTRVNICIRDEDIKNCNKNKVIEKLVKIKKEDTDSNFAIRFDYYTDELNIDLLIENNIKFYFNKYVSEWDDFFILKSMGVSDIYITEELGFELDKVKKIAEGISIRAFPNVAQKKWDKLSPLKSFFIRPEDVEEYEKYIDVLEFYGDRDNHTVLYKIYAKDKQWFGNLNELIIGLDLDIDSRFIIPRFPQKRIRCDRECLKGGMCNMCDKILDLSKTLKSADLMVKIDKKGVNK